MTKELLIKFLENQCTPDELEKVLFWIEKEALLEGKDLAYDDWKSFRNEEACVDLNVSFNSLLDKIHHKININQSSGPRTRQLRISSQVTTWLTKAAAILLIPVLSILIYTLSFIPIHTSKYADMVVDSLEIVAPTGSRTVVQLSDGTEVHLNSGSKIKYPRSFDGENRELSLSGEGFFDVAHDPEHPFVVKTKRVNVKALGTKFNVLSYPENDAVATTLVEGKVVMERFTEDGKIENIETMTPGQHVEYNINSGKASSTNRNIEKYIAWKDGLLIFDNSNINEVAERLSRMFNVEIEAAHEIEDYTYTVKFVDESLTQILDLLTKATPVDYVFLPREKLPDGTYYKQKIILKERYEHQNFK
ncbi:MAG: FecR family protein [Mangrovibacterium sp.]|tara:strand:- start:24358 stop:25443 length:1086 start_codon:yes stop_codon:yes gene_type:complete